jgi:hypothetical protein
MVEDKERWYSENPNRPLNFYCKSKEEDKVRVALLVDLPRSIVEVLKEYSETVPAPIKEVYQDVMVVGAVMYIEAMERAQLTIRTTPTPTPTTLEGKEVEDD